MALLLMNSIRLNRYIIYLYLATLVLFSVNKFVVRPFVLEHDYPAFFQVLVLSIPNTFEAIIGMSNFGALLIALKFYLDPRLDGPSNTAIYFIAAVLAGTYVLAQEYKIHNLGGRNTYDPYDVVASCIGVAGMLLLFCRYGIMENTNSG